MNLSYAPVALAIKAIFPTLADQRYSAAGFVWCPACTVIRGGHVGFARHHGDVGCPVCSGSRKIVALEVGLEVLASAQEEYRLIRLEAAVAVIERRPADALLLGGLRSRAA